MKVLPCLQEAVDLVLASGIFKITASWGGPYGDTWRPVLSDPGRFVL